MFAHMGILSTIRSWAVPSGPSTDSESRSTAWTGYPSINNPNTPIADAILGAQRGASVQHASQPMHAGVAIGVPPFVTAIKIIAEDIAGGTVETQVDAGEGRWEVDYTDPLNAFFQTPSPDYSWSSIVESWIANAGLVGDSVTQIIRRQGTVQELRVGAYDEAVIWEDTRGRMWYQLYGRGYQTGPLYPDEVIHIKGFSFDGRRGLNNTLALSSSLRTHIQAQSYINETLRDNKYGIGAIGIKESLGEGPAGLRAKVAMSDYVAGELAARRIPVLDHGAQFLASSLSPNDMSYSEVLSMTAGEVASYLRISLDMLNDREASKSKKDTEQMAHNHVRFCLKPWIRRIEDELERKLYSPDERNKRRIKWNMSSLLKGDSKAVADYLTKMMTAQLMTINEARAVIDLPPVPDGDRFVDFQKSKNIDKENINTKTVAPHEEE